MDNKKLVETVANNLGRTTEDVNKLMEAFASVLYCILVGMLNIIHKI